MLDIVVRKSDLGLEYRDVTIIVGDTIVNLGNVLFEDLADSLEQLSFDADILIKEMYNEDFNS